MMKTLPLKKLALGVVGILILGAGVFYLSTRSESKPAPDFINPAFGEHISSYTSGVISSQSAIQVVLAQDAVDSSFFGKESSAKLFSLSPSVNGKTIWLDARTVQFKPEGRLSSGQIYKIQFYLSKLFEVPKGLETFEYSLQVIPQNYEVNIDNIKPYEKTDLKRQKIEGTLLTADFADSESVEKVFASVQEGKTLRVSWIHAGEGRQHNFTIEDVARRDEASKVKINVTGKGFGVDRTHEQEVEIPSLKDFKLVNAKVVQNPSQYIALQFSDPLREQQNLKGLITVQDVDNLDFTIQDNEILVYLPGRQTGKKVVRIEAGVRNILDYRMQEPATAEVMFEQVAPAVRFTSKGSILPSTHGLVLPFEAVNLNSVDVTVTRIYENNILQFLQVNNLDGSSELYRVGKKVIKKTIPLNTSGVTDLGKWNRFTLDVSQLIQTEPGAIYQVKLSFKRGYSTYACEDEPQEESASSFESDEEPEYDYDGYYEEDYYYYDDYDWRERDNPCNNSYYTSNRSIKKNILASDLGLTAKRGGDGQLIVFATDIKSTEGLSGVQVDVYNYQQQVVGSGTTSSDGKAVLTTKETPFALVARHGNHRGYLKLGDGDALPVSSFDVSGESVQKGLKGFLYGDRGVWRPGDSLYLTFILEDKLKQFPDNHPVVFELQNPQGQIVNRIVRSNSENGFYSFATSTSADAPTGVWTGRVKAGALTYTQPLRIETVKPNRLKINLDFGTEKFTNADINGSLQVNWLHGAPGRNLKGEFDVILAASGTSFPKFKDYVFEDPSREFTSESQRAFEGHTDAEGRAPVSLTLPSAESAPGLLTAIFRGKVFEESGNFSTDRFSIPYSPFDTYVGMKAPEGEKYSGILYFDQSHTIELATVDADGNPVSRNNLKVSMYKLKWRWWWDNSYEGIANYIDGSYSKLVREGTTRTVNGKGTWNFEMKSDKDEYGRYFVRVCDAESGHCTGTVVYVDEPGWYSRVRDEETGGANILSFSTDKASYNIGEKVTVTIPSHNQGRALVSIENGTRVIESNWVQTQQGETKYTFEATSDMAPNVYVSVMLIQPHAQTVNDLPVRLYGVTGVSVQDPKTKLEPVLELPNEIQPGQEVNIRVSERSNRRMTYTVAVVDEGLLDITRFKTPDAWSRFYSKEALGVRTFDVFDYVMGAFGTNLERVLSVGGDEELKSKEDDAKANRFKPVVKFFGPFTLSGGTATHKFVMPQYIGSVKTMVVAGHDGAYGKAEAVTRVRKPLMVLATLPRVLGPDESVSLPVTLFANDKNIQNVNVEIKADGGLSVIGESKKSIRVSSSGDVTMDFAIKVAPQTGIAKVTVNASSGSFKASDEIEIEIRNPNLPVSKITESLLEAGGKWRADITPYGVAGTNTAVVEISNLPPVNLGWRLRYLMQYPYGCVEQTTSAVFPQLFLEQIKVLTDVEKANIQRNVTAAIERLKSFQRPDGGFSYWPGGDDSDSWGTSYAGHFLFEAESRGFFVPAEMMKRWKKFQKNKAAEWRRSDKYYNNDLMQAYRLYTLAIGGSAEVGAMNRLQEESNVSATAMWMLASAYAKLGQPEAAKRIISNLNTTVKPYRELGYSYGSDVRDKALILETLVLLNDKAKAFDLLKELSKYLGDAGYWLSTQETAMALKAIGSFAGMDKRGDIKYAHTLNGKTTNAVSALPVSQIQVPISGLKAQNVEIINNGSGLLYARLIMEGTPARGSEEDGENNLALTVRYTDMKGREIDVKHLEQGTEFMAEVSVLHTGIRSYYQNLALSQVFPSGWEINNLRLTGDEGLVASSGFDYQDIRDDRVYTYFGLSPNERRTFRVSLTATYAGSYYMPAVNCEAMYDKSIYARKRGYVVDVIKPVTP